MQICHFCIALVLHQEKYYNFEEIEIMPVVWKAANVLNRRNYAAGILLDHLHVLTVDSCAYKEVCCRFFLGIGISPDRDPLNLLKPTTNLVSPGEAGSQLLICSNRQLSIIASK